MGARVIFSLTDRQAQVLEALSHADRAQAIIRLRLESNDFVRAVRSLERRGLLELTPVNGAHLTDPGRIVAGMVASLGLASLAPSRQG